MPLKKYNTTSSILEHMQAQRLVNPQSSSSSPKSGSSSCSSPQEKAAQSNESAEKVLLNPSTLADITKLMPSIIEAASSEAVADYTDDVKTFLPIEIKSRLYKIFTQIEREFNLLYAENVKLQQQLFRANCKNKCFENSSLDEKRLDICNNSSSSSTLVAAPLTKITQSMSPKLSSKPILEKSISQSASLVNFVSSSSLSNQVHANLSNMKVTGEKSNSTTKSAAFLSSKARINNLSFPKFKPNAREFIMQSIKNTSAQIVNKTQNNSSGFNSKHQCSLTGHKDGIWDISCISIPSHLFCYTNSFNQNSLLNNQNLLIGTASADSTARLWYLNSHSTVQSSQLSSQNQQHSPHQNHQNQPSWSANNYITSQVTNGFCIQQYCGHTGSVNSIRFHPRFFTDATNLILTASGDSQAHIWQCVLSPVNDSFESTSGVVLNYNKCYSFAINNSNMNNNVTASHSISPHSQIMSSSFQQNFSSNNLNPFQSPTSKSTNYQELFANTPVIRSPIKRFEGHSDVCIAAEWFPEGDMIATASWDRSANVYNVETGKILCNLQHDDYLTNVTIHPKNKIILTSSKDTTFKVWDFRDPICSVNVYQGHNRAVNSAIFVNEDKIATSSDDQTLKLWDIRIMRSPIVTINVNSGVNRICTMSASSDNNLGGSGETYICLPLDNRDIKIYNLQGERIVRMPRSNRVGHHRLVTSLASCNNFLVSASFDKLVNCWSLDSNPTKSSSSATNTKCSINNKENNAHLIESIGTPNFASPNEQMIFNVSTSGQKSFDSKLAMAGSFSPPNQIITPSNQSPAISNSNQTSGLPPLTGKSINTLSKLAERIKI